MGATDGDLPRPSVKAPFELCLRPKNHFLIEAMPASPQVFQNRGPFADEDESLRQVVTRLAAALKPASI